MCVPRTVTPRAHAHTERIDQSERIPQVRSAQPSTLFMSVHTRIKASGRQSDAGCDQPTCDAVTCAISTRTAIEQVWSTALCRQTTQKTHARTRHTDTHIHRDSVMYNAVGISPLTPSLCSKCTCALNCTYVRFHDLSTNRSRRCSRREDITPQGLVPQTRRPPHSPVAGRSRRPVVAPSVAENGS